MTQQLTKKDENLISEKIWKMKNAQEPIVINSSLLVRVISLSFVRYFFSASRGKFTFTSCLADYQPPNYCLAQLWPPGNEPHY